jgi:acyl-coenzyme A thioesterase PaaI-like protein
MYDEDFDGIDHQDTNDAVEGVKLQSHERIKTYLCGSVIEIRDNFARVSLATNADMSIDEEGLVHSGFIFSAADHCAHVAINKIHTVLIAANVKFYAPIKTGDIAIFEAQARFEDSRKREVLVKGHLNDVKIFEGTFITVTLDDHALKKRVNYRKKKIVNIEDEGNESKE